MSDSHHPVDQPRRSVLRRTAVAATAVVATAGIGGGVAYAATSGGSGTKPSATPTTRAHSRHLADAVLAKNPTLAQIQAAATTDINNRVTVLNDAATKVKQATYLGSDQATLLRPLQADPAALQALDAKIHADTTTVGALADFKQIFTGCRVYALVIPQTQLVAAADRIDNRAASRLSRMTAKIQSRVTSADAGQIDPLLSDAAKQASAAKAATSGLQATVEGYTVSQFNADHHLLVPDRDKVRSAIGDSKNAASDLKQAVRDLRQDRGATAPGSAGGTTSASATSSRS